MFVLSIDLMYRATIGAAEMANVEENDEMGAGVFLTSHFRLWGCCQDFL